jgi:hypothetical protein
MFEEGSSQALVAVDQEWRPILQASNQVVLYNPTSHALTIRPSTRKRLPSTSVCPYCNRSMPLDEEDSDFDAEDRAANYFQLLEVSNETYSRPSTPPPIPHQEGGDGGTFAETMAQGYFKTFFREEHRLGMGANGSVFLCQVRHFTIQHETRNLKTTQHMLDGNKLGLNLRGRL